MTDKLCIDLCSGLGGFSQAFVDAGWDVLRIDNDPKFLSVPFTLRRDITKLDWAQLRRNKERHQKTVMLMSPPCERFSLANHTWPKPGIQKAMEIVGACLEGVAQIRPDEWMLENPKARLRWFLGKPTGTIRLSDYGAPYLKPTDYWGSVILPMLSQTTPLKMYLRPMKHDKKTPSPIYLSGTDKAGRAKMPYGLSQAVLEAVSQP